MSEPRCETCRFWESPVDSYVHATVGACLVARMNRVVLDEGGGYESVPHDSCALDYQVCDRITGPKFGCVKWKASDKPGER